MHARPGLAVAGLFLAGQACSSHPGARPRTLGAVEPANDSDPLTYVSPAHWDFHPAQPDAVVAQLKLADGTCVVATEGGQRWTVAPDRAANAATAGCVGAGRAAHALAPEPLVAVLRHGRAWLFAGASGTLFEAAEPLGAFTRTIAAPEPFATVAGDGSTVLAVTLDGRLMRWDESAGWRPGTTVAPPPARLFAVALGESGRALGLAFPEALFTSDDAGVTWKPAIGAPTIGADRVGVSDAGALVAQGPVDALAWQTARSRAADTSTRARAALARTTERLADVPEPSQITAGRTQTAASVAAGSAVIAGDRYLEVYEPEAEAAPIQLARGRIEGRLDVTPLPIAHGCSHLRIGASSKHVVVACIRTSGDQALATVYRSDDGGAKWTPPLELRAISDDAVRIAVGPDGAALVTGMCRDAQPCKPEPPVMVRLEGGKLATSATSAPQLRGGATLPAFSPDGRAAYFVGSYAAKASNGNGAETLFVSRDGGESFSARTLEPPRAAKGRKRTEDEADDDDEDPDANGTQPIELGDASALTVGDDGTVGIVAGRRGRAAYVSTDADGRVQRVARAPHERAEIAGWGRRALAIVHEPTTTAGAETKVWESLDAGQSWADVPPTSSLDRDLAQGAPAIACGAGGCLVNDSISRVGWNGQVESASTPDRGADAAATGEPALRTAIACELAPGARWVRIDHVDPETDSGLPDVNQAMRGRTAWSLLSYEHDTGAVSATTATLPESCSGEARIATRQLLGRSSGSGRLVVDVSHQMEGYAAARLRAPVDAKGDPRSGATMQNVEVAWDNYMDGTSGHATIPDAGTLQKGDIGNVDDRNTLKNALLSVSVRSLFVRPHAAASSRATFLLDASGRSQRFDYPAWPTEDDPHPLPIFGDLAMVDGHPIGVGLVQAPWPSTVLLAHREARAASSSGQPPMKAARADAGSTWAITITALAPPARDEWQLVSQTEWTYSGATIGLTSFVADAKRERAWGLFHAFRSDGTFAPARAVPTLLDLADRPRPCSATERGSTPRVEAILFARGHDQPLFSGTRHPVLVSEAPQGRGALARALDDTEAVLLTAAAVVHGTPSSPCIAAWYATGIGREPLAAIVSGDLTHAWLFRRAVGEQGDGPTPPAARHGRGQGGDIAVEVRAMSCHYDGSAKVPDRVLAEPGTRRSH